MYVLGILIEFHFPKIFKIEGGLYITYDIFHIYMKNELTQHRSILFFVLGTMKRFTHFVTLRNGGLSFLQYNNNRKRCNRQIF